MLDPRQEGLSAVEIIIIVVLLAVVGVAAWTKLGRNMDAAASFSFGSESAEASSD